MLELACISKTFNPGTVNEKKALSGVALRLEKGDFVTIVGSNGAGKSTLFNAIAGAFYVDEGAIRLAGEDGVAAYGVIMYVNLIFLGVFIGYSIGSAPVVSYHFGADNRAELRGLLRRSLGILAVMSVAMTVLAEALALPLARIFVGYDAALLEMTRHGFMLYSLSFLFAGGGIFGSAFFTALNNGAVSALISFLRALVFQMAAVLLLPRLMGLDGVWLAVVAAEALAVAVAAACFAAKRKTYGY